MSEDTRTILKKLLRDALDEKDRQRLLCDPKVEERMRSQWDEAADRVNPMVGNRMWKRIIARTMATNGVRKLWVYKITAIAASILLLLGVGSVVYWSHTKEDQYIYVMASGVRCIESVSLSAGTTVRMGPNLSLIHIFGQRYGIAPASLGEEVTIGIRDRVVRHIQNRLTDYPRSVAAYIGTFIIVQGYFGFQL